MTKKVKLSETTDIFKDVQILSLEGVTMEGDIELDVGLRSGFNPMLAAALGQESAILAQQFSILHGMLGVPAGRGAHGTAPAVSTSRATKKSKDLIPAKRA